MFRQPSDREALWVPWRQRLVGRAFTLTSEPLCGLYQMRAHGRYVGVQIDLVQEIDPESGELLAEEVLSAWVDGALTDPSAVWERCSDHPISEEAFERLKGRPAVTDLTRSVIV